MSKVQAAARIDPTQRRITRYLTQQVPSPGTGACPAAPAEAATAAAGVDPAAAGPSGVHGPPPAAAAAGAAGPAASATQPTAVPAPPAQPRGRRLVPVWARPAAPPEVRAMPPVEQAKWQARIEFWRGLHSFASKGLHTKKLVAWARRLGPHHPFLAAVPAGAGAGAAAGDEHDDDDNSGARLRLVVTCGPRITAYEDIADSDDDVDVAEAEADATL